MQVNRFNAGLMLTFLIIGALAPGAPAQGEPEWVRFIGPVDYVMLREDLKPPLTMSDQNTIDVELTSRGVKVRTEKGERTVRTATLHATQGIQLPDTASGATCGIAVEVTVYETPDIARASLKSDGLIDGLTLSGPDDNKLGDARLAGGDGCSTGLGSVVRYRNAVLKLFHHGQQLESERHYPLLAKLWLDKVTAATGIRLARAARAAAEGRTADGTCYRYVRAAVTGALGVHLTGASAWQAAPQFAASPDFREITGLTPSDLPKLPPGCIVVWAKSRRLPNGHIAITLGKGLEASDHVARQVTDGGGAFRVFRAK